MSSDAARVYEQQAGYRPAGRRGIAMLGAALIAFYILFPLDRGFPRVPFFGRPLSPAVAATLLAFAVLVVHSRGRVFRGFRSRYCVVLSFYFLLLIVASLRADAPLAALQLSVVFYCTFVVNYAVLLYVARHAGVSQLVSLVVWAGLAAAVIGVMQGLFGVRLGMYEEWYMRYFQAQLAEQSDVGVRGVGTLNNPILYGTAMVLLVPYVFTLRSVWVRVVILSLTLVAAALTGSRTVLLVLFVFMVGAVVVYRWRTLWMVPVLAVVVAIGVWQLGGWDVAVSDPQVRFLAGRIGVGDEASSQDAASSIDFRREVLAHGVSGVTTQWGPATWLFGKGQFTAAELGEAVSVGYNTVDNAFFGVLYEKGVVGLFLFVWAFIAHLRATRVAARTSLHWYAPLALLAVGVSFDFDAYSTFNILAVGSMAIAAALAGQEVRQAARVMLISNGRRRAIPQARTGG